MKLIYCLMILLCPFVSIGQMVKPLTIGDSIPRITITNVYNYPASKIQLTDLKGKVIILDFWSSWCSACLQSFPKMERLKNQFGDKLEIILVNSYKGDSIQRIKALFEKRKIRTGESINLPYSLLQSSLKDYFPYRFVPHYVWINKEGVVAAITSASEITAGNISEMIDGKNVAFHTKKDNLAFDYKKPLFVKDNGGNGDDFLYRSIITHYKEGLGFTVSHSQVKRKYSRFIALNQPVAALLEVAFPKEMAVPANRRYYLGNNSDSLKAIIESENLDNLYCYEIIAPVVTHKELLHYIREDMIRFFGIVVHTEIRKIKCEELRAPQPDKVNYTRHSIPLAHYSSKYEKKFMRDVPVSFVVDVLNNFLDCPVIDKTGIHKAVDIELPDDLTDQAAVRRAIINAGFTLTTCEKEMEVAVISKQNIIN